ncbi:hypothetical protein B0J18DRAFT_110852 [Chaetomium sp. MPI-SDFR-AT-0129]|nr:hypothetical protein B0J18DRAFT_110852 [Chaetomium sp. MPI-SDFR-AT-0129]
MGRINLLRLLGSLTLWPILEGGWMLQPSRRHRCGALVAARRDRGQDRARDNKSRHGLGRGERRDPSFSEGTFRAGRKKPNCHHALRFLLCSLFPKPFQSSYVLPGGKHRQTLHAKGFPAVVCVSSLPPVRDLLPREPRSWMCFVKPLIFTPSTTPTLPTSVIVLNRTPRSERLQTLCF